jgi:hypothetical protein
MPTGGRLAAVWWQTGRLLDDERQRLREVFEHERGLARRAANDARQFARQAAEKDRQGARAAITAVDLPARCT